MSQQSVRQSARRSALDAQAVLRKQRADRERRLEGLAVAVLTALGERDGAVRDAERRAGQALQTMTEDEGLSVREAVEWCGRGAHGAGGQPATPTCAGSAGRQRPISARCIDRLGRSLNHQSGNPVGVAAVALASSSTVCGACDCSRAGAPSGGTSRSGVLGIVSACTARLR